MFPSLYAALMKAMGFDDGREPDAIIKAVT